MNIQPFLEKGFWVCLTGGGAGGGGGGTVTSALRVGYWAGGGGGGEFVEVTQFSESLDFQVARL